MLAKSHELRNQGEYEGDLNVDERFVADLISACKAVGKHSVRFLRPEPGKCPVQIVAEAYQLSSRLLQIIANPENA